MISLPVSRSASLIIGLSTVLPYSPDGDIGQVSALFNHTVPRTWHDDHPERLLAEIALKEGLAAPYFGMLTAVPMGTLVICRSGFLTVFITAGISNHTINIIGVSSEGLSRSGLLECLITAASAKTRALLENGRAIQRPLMRLSWPVKDPDSTGMQGPSLLRGADSPPVSGKG